MVVKSRTAEPAVRPHLILVVSRKTYIYRKSFTGPKLISVKCPDCGQTLSIEENSTQAFCTYCGAKVLISNENEYIPYRPNTAP